jgi:hypothetical protein
MVNTALGIAGLFFIVGMMSRRRGSRLIGDFGGWQRVTPLLAGTFLVIGLANLAMPGLGPFVSEFLVLIGTYTRYPVAAVVATVGIILAALYVLVLYQRTMTGRVRSADGVRDLGGREMFAVAPLIALLLVLGLYPRPVLDVINPAVERTLDEVGVEDPAPTVRCRRRDVEVNLARGRAVRRSTQRVRADRADPHRLRRRHRRRALEAFAPRRVRYLSRSAPPLPSHRGTRFVVARG